MKAFPASTAGFAAFALAFAAPSPAASPDRGEDEVSRLVTGHLRSGGSWFTPAERALIERKCGYAPGEWDGFELNLSRGTLTCTNGRVVEDPETRAVLKAAEPRINARVEAVMARADVAAAIGRVADAAAAEALREMDSRRQR